MKKLFGKRKDKDKEAGGAAAGGTTPAAPSQPFGQPLPPLRLSELQQQGSGVPSGRSGGPATGGSSGRALVYTDSGYLRGVSPTTSGNFNRSLSRTASNMSSGRRSARRPREVLDLSQPEPQVEGDEEWEWESYVDAELEGDAELAAALAASEGGDAAQAAGAGSTASGSGRQYSRQLSYEEEKAQIEADMAMAYQLAMQDQAGAQQPPAGGPPPPLDQQPPPALLQRTQQGQAAPPGAQWGSRPPPHPQWGAPPPYQRQTSGPLPAGFGSGSLSHTLSQTYSQSMYSTASEDVALASALAESQFAAQQAAAQAALTRAKDAEYQAAIEAAMEESMVTINYDGLLRDIQLWVFDLEGATGDVSKALQEATGDTSEIDRQMAAANPDDAEGMHRLLWLSEQYPLVQERLKELAGRVAPVSEAIKALKDLGDYIRNDQPPLSDAESVRDAVIARLFQDLTRQGLDAHHPFAAYGEGEGGEETARKRGGGLLRLLSKGKKEEKPAPSRGGDLRDLVRQLIEEAKRIPPPPPLPVDYGDLLAELRGWARELPRVKEDVQAVIEDVHGKQEEAVAQLDAADPADKPGFHAAEFYGEQYPQAVQRLRALEQRCVPPSKAATEALQALVEEIPVTKPSLEEAKAKRDVAVGTLLAALALGPLLPESPGPADVRAAVQRLTKEAALLPPMPAFVDYTALLEDMQQWVQDLEQAQGQLEAAAVAAGGAAADNAAALQRSAKSQDPEGWHRLTWLSEQLPGVEGRLAEVVAKLAPSGDAVKALQDARDYILASKPPLGEAEAMRDRAIGDLMVALFKNGLDARPLTPHDNQPGGGTAATRDVSFCQYTARLVDEAKRLPAMPGFVDRRPLLADLRQWVAELEGAQADVQAAQAAADEAASSNATQRAGADEGADPEGWHRLSWLSEQYPRVAARLQEAGGKVQPGTSAAIQSLRELCQRVESTEPPVEEAGAERDAAVASLAAALAAQGVQLPQSPASTDVREAVRHLIDEARNLPGMPQWEDHRQLLADLRQWVAELEGARGDVQAAQAAAAESTAGSTAQLGAADEGADPEGWHRLNWLSQQHPLVESRLAEVGGRVGPAAGSAIDALQQLERHVQSSKPPLEEAEAARDAAVAALVAGMALEGLPSPPTGPGVRSAVQHQIADAERLPAMPGFVDYGPLLADLRQWVAELEAARGDVLAAQAAAQQTSAATAAEFAAVDGGADPEGWHRLSWLSKEHPLLSSRVEAVQQLVAPSADAAIDSLQQLEQRIKSSKPPLEEAEAARDAAVAALVAGMALEGLPQAPAGAAVRSSVQQMIADAQRLPAMPGFVDHRPLLADLRQWVAELEGAQADVQASQAAAAESATEDAKRLAVADQAADPEAHYRLNWLSQQHPLVESRLAEVGGRVGPAAGSAIDALQQLEQHVKSSKPPLEEAEGARDEAISALLAAAALEGLPSPPAGTDVREAVRGLVADAQRLPDMPPMPVNYEDLLADLRQWVAELEGSQADVQAAQTAAAESTAGSAAQLGAADEGADPEGWHRLNWLSQQQPMVEERLGGLGAKLAPAAPAAVLALQELVRAVEEDKPALEVATAQRDAAVVAIMEELSSQGINVQSAADMRSTVRQLIADAQRLPAMPGFVDHRPLLADLQQWVAELERARGDVQAAQAAAAEGAADTAAQLAAADEEADPEGWHRLNWLSQQHPLVESRLAEVGGRVGPAAGSAIDALQQLERHVQSSKPPLEEAEAARDAAVAALVAGMALEGLPSPASQSSVRGGVRHMIAEAQRVPAMPGFVDYGPLLADLRQWVAELEGARGDVQAAQAAQAESTAANGAELQSCDIQADPEGWHRLNWLSQQLPQAQARLEDVATRVEPTGVAARALHDLQQQVESEKPALAAAERTRDEALAALVAGLALRKLSARPSSGEVRDAVGALVSKAQHLPPVPPMPVPAYVAPPAPEGLHRTPLVAPKFNPPNISAPRPRKKSRGIKPAPEDAIKRDPRAITLYNELANGRGIVVTTIDWEPLAKQYGGAGGKGAGTPGGSAGGTPRGSASGTPRRGSATPPAPARSPARSPAGSAQSSAAATPRTPTPQPPSPSPEPSAPEPEMSEEEAAAYLPTLPARALAVAGFEPRTLQDVSDFVSDVKAQGGDAPRSAHAAAGFPTRKWALMCEAGSVFDQLLDACDALTKWQCPPQANVVAESHRLAAYLDAASKVTARVNYPHDPLRTRLAKAGLPWDGQLLTDLRWAAQRAGAALMRHALDGVERAAKVKGQWQSSAIVQPLGSAFIATFRVHQFCGGFNLECAALFDTLHERTVHFSRMIDPKWFRSHKVTG